MFAFHRDKFSSGWATDAATGKASNAADNRRRVMARPFRPAEGGPTIGRARPSRYWRSCGPGTKRRISTLAPNGPTAPMPAAPGGILSRRTVTPAAFSISGGTRNEKSENWSRGAAAGAMALLLMFGTPAQAAENPQVAAEVMALARAQWASEIAGEPMAQQNVPAGRRLYGVQRRLPDIARRQVHVDANGRGHAQRQGDVLRHAERRVQVYGDTAILTYNFAGLSRAADGKVDPSLAKSTRVYAKQGGQVDARPRQFRAGGCRTLGSGEAGPRHFRRGP